MSKPFVMGHASAPGWRDAIDSSLDRMGAVSASANLGFLYVTDVLSPYMGEILEQLRQRTAVEHWVGTVGVGICATNVEYVDEPAVAAMLAELPRNSFRVFHSQDTNDNQPVFFSEREHGQAGNFGVVHGNPNTLGIGMMMEALAGELESGFLVGGLSSSREQFPQVANGVHECSLSGVVFSDEVIVATRLTQGCTPIGPKHEITDCSRNVIVALDDKPALDVFKHEAGDVIAKDLNRAAGHIFAGLPVQGSDTDEYLVRNLIGIDPDRDLIAIGDMVEPGQHFLFCRRDGVVARRDMERMLGELKSSLPGKPRGAVYYSCLGRGQHMFGERSAELNMISETFGDLPLVGFFANGEISHNRLYGYTGVLTLFM